MRKVVCIILALAFILSDASVCCAEEAQSLADVRITELYSSRVTNYFSLSVDAQGKSYVSSSLLVEASEAVRINANYSPASVSIYVGLIDEDGQFHYASATNGKIDVTIEIEERGNYWLAVMNNSKYTVTVTGYVVNSSVS